MHLDSIALGNALSTQQSSGGARGSSTETRTESSESTARSVPNETNEIKKTNASEKNTVTGLTTEKAEAAEEKSKPSELEGQLLRSSRLQLSFHVDESTERVVISVIDRESQEVVRQVPPEEVLKLAERLETIRGSFVSSTV